MALSGTRTALAAAALLAAAPLASAHEFWVFFGTNTGGKSGSKGIYRAKFNNHTGKMTEPELAAEVGNPTFLAIHPNQKFLYSVGESSGKDGGGVYSFALDAKTGSLTKLNQGTSGGAGPCHISVHPKGTHVIVANYVGGSTAIFKLNTDGSLGERTTFVQHTGSGKDPGRQKAPHAHCGFFSPDGNTAYSVDLGIDRVKVFRFDPATGKADDGPEDIATPPGSGPRHIAIAPDAKFAYVCGELNSTVNVIELSSDGTGKVVQSLSTLPKPVKGNSTAECILSPDGKFVYVSNRVGDSIAVFKVGDDRNLTAAGHITGDIKIPRNFNIDPSGRWMLIASQDGGKVGAWERDLMTGLAKEAGITVPVSRCVCVKFVPVAK